MSLTPEASEAVHKTKNAQQAIEVAREAQLREIAAETVRLTKDALLEGLKEVFGEGDQNNPQQMKVLVQRIPILCIDIKNMGNDITEIRDNQKWAMRAAIGLLVTGAGAILIAATKIVFM